MYGAGLRVQVALVHAENYARARAVRARHVPEKRGKIVGRSTKGPQLRPKDFPRSIPKSHERQPHGKGCKKIPHASRTWKEAEARTPAGRVDSATSTRLQKQHGRQEMGCAQEMAWLPQRLAQAHKLNSSTCAAAGFAQVCWRFRACGFFQDVLARAAGDAPPRTLLLRSPHASCKMLTSVHCGLSFRFQACWLGMLETCVVKSSPLVVKQSAGEFVASARPSWASSACACMPVAACLASATSTK